MKSKEPLVSVIMNCFNSDQYLKESIDSVISQTYYNWEMIFWDNQSTDRSAKIVRFYNDKRINYFYAPYHTNLGEARNEAINKCRGDWIAFLDCDDLWDSRKLSIAVEKINKESSDIGLVYDGAIIIDAKTKKLKHGINYYASGKINEVLLKKGNFITFSSILVNACLLRSVGKINPKLEYCEDYDLLLKVTKSKKAIAINHILTYYRVHEKSITSLNDFKNTVEEVEFLIEYLQNNSIKLGTMLLVYKNIIYKVTTLFIKQLIDKKIENIFFLQKKYIKYLIFSIFIIPEIVCNKIIKRKD